VVAALDAGGLSQGDDRPHVAGLTPVMDDRQVIALVHHVSTANACSPRHCRRRCELRTPAFAESVFGSAKSDRRTSRGGESVDHEIPNESLGPLTGRRFSGGSITATAQSDPSFRPHSTKPGTLRYRRQRQGDVVFGQGGSAIEHPSGVSAGSSDSS
jgi:hypothetical protein